MADKRLPINCEDCGRFVSKYGEVRIFHDYEYGPEFDGATCEPCLKTSRPQWAATRRAVVDLYQTHIQEHPWWVMRLDQDETDLIWVIDGDLESPLNEREYARLQCVMCSQLPKDLGGRACSVLASIPRLLPTPTAQDAGASVARGGG